MTKIPYTRREVAVEEIKQLNYNAMALRCTHKYIFLKTVGTHPRAAVEHTVI